MKKNNAYIVVGLGFGDEGKGTMTDYLCRKNDAMLVVRANGGSQAGHNVVTDDGRHHTFTQFGSGSFIPGVKTLLSRYMMWDPIILAEEASELSAATGEYMIDRHFIDRRAPVITQFHVAANRIKEWMRGKGRHGSCGRGIGELGSDLMYVPEEVVRAENLFDPRGTKKILEAIQKRKFLELQKLNIDWNDLPELLQDSRKILTDAAHPIVLAYEYEKMVRAYTILSAHEVNAMIRENTAVFECAQGVLLDEWHGFHPYTTWTTTLQTNPLEILKEAGFEGKTETIGVTRCYSTRHGAGPFVTEDENFRDIYPGENNYFGEWQGSFRTGYFDGVAFRYALECLRHYGRIDSLAITHLDAFERKEALPFADLYTGENGEAIRNLKPAYDRDLSYQQALTEMIMKAKPMITGTWHTTEEVIKYMQKTGRVPVKYVSYGPASGQKQTLIAARKEENC
ncbi:MAG: adenylosuccinate synthetase [Candidatus Paceibacterota bacterium]|jgi:adenylosuccinate synthase|nr:adenylosuccinate synthetase [Candidatus Paceibacterota bacterium]